MGRTVAAALSESDGGNSAEVQSQRRALIEVIDRLVAYEHYYKSVYGHFTKLISRLGYPIPIELSEVYDIRVSEAVRDHLLISAFSEVDGRTRDTVTIDQDYEVRSNFSLPAPRAEYLTSLAYRHLRRLRDASAGDSPAELGAYRGYFRYETRRNPRDSKGHLAVGIKAPVLGLQLELGTDDATLAELDEPGTDRTGQKPVENVMSTLEEAYLAQRIFHGEVGRYARNWAELSKIASFKFEEKSKFGKGEGSVPFGDETSVQEIDASSAGAPGAPKGDSERVPSSDVQPIEIEPIY